MNRHLVKLTLSAAVLVLSGCAKPIPPDVLANADYGPPPPASHQDTIKDAFAPLLIDPTSPLYTFNEPSKGYTERTPKYGFDNTFGWRVCGTINSKNRMGGYTGKAPFFTLFKDGKMVSQLLGEVPSQDMYAISFVNRTVHDLCAR